MQDTKAMCIGIAVLALTWSAVALVASYMADVSFKEGLSHGGTLFIMLCVGWAPAIYVSSDYLKWAKKQDNERNNS